MVLLLWVVLIGIVGGLYYLIFHFFEAEASLNNVGAFVTVLAVYAVLGWFIRPQVDRDNLGMFGTMIDRPFDYSDDWERTKLNWAILLYPGRLMASAVVGLVRLLRQRRGRESPPPPLAG